MGVDYLSKDEAKRFAELKPGDHIAWKRALGSSWDHAIVESIRATDHEISVIHYTLATDKPYLVHNDMAGTDETRTRGPEKKRVERTVVKEAEEGKKLHRLQENLGCFYSPEVIIEKAKQRLGEQSYHMLKNNDEDFVLSCRGVLMRRDYARKDEVRSFENLSAADHVAWTIYSGLPLHHVLVEFVCPKKKEVTIIYYTTATDQIYTIHNKGTGEDQIRTRGSGIRRVERQVIKEGEMGDVLFQLVEYAEHQVDVYETLKRAWQRLGEQEYNFLTNDDRDFVLHCRGCKMLGWQNTAKRVGTTAGIVIGCSLAAVTAPVLIVAGLGFGAGGVVAGSAAAGMMSAAGNVAAGSAIATMQSIGAAGLAASTQAALVGGGAAMGAATAAAVDNARST